MPPKKSFISKHYSVILLVMMISLAIIIDGASLSSSLDYEESVTLTPEEQAATTKMFKIILLVIVCFNLLVLGVFGSAFIGVVIAALLTRNKVMR